MKTAKLVTGILCMVFTLLVLLQSCAVGVSNIIEESGEASGTAGFLVAIFMLAGGIVEVSTRKSTGKGGAIASMILFFLAALLGFSNVGRYTDLKVWSSWCLICGILNLISMFTGNRKAEKVQE